MKYNIDTIVENFNFNSIRHDNVGEQFTNEILGLVDLGLPSGTLWSNCNLGAKQETDDGGYYTYYDVIDGIVQKTLGDNFCAPSKEDFAELISCCKTKWIQNYENGNGMLFTGKNGNSILFPASGYKTKQDPYDFNYHDYMVCSWSTDAQVSNPYVSWHLVCNYKGVVDIRSNNRFYYQTVRPIFKKQIQNNE